jgi:hypothetical protein
MREIERANPDTLYRVFGAADWGNRAMLTDEILKDLVEGLSEVLLGNKAVSSDILGERLRIPDRQVRRQKEAHHPQRPLHLPTVAPYTC